MKSIDFLDKTLTYAEYQAAMEVYAGIVERDIEPTKAAAMMYRHGLLVGKERQREQYRKVRQAQLEYRANKINSQPMADNEGDNSNE